jgi:uncharacterized protein
LYILFNLNKLFLSSTLIEILLSSFICQQSYGTRPQYVYDNAKLINAKYMELIEDYLRDMDSQTSAEIVIFTIPSFIGYGIKKDAQEILDGIKGIGKKDKDNGILVLYSLKRDGGGGSMRIEVGRGLEGNITDGTAGAILDSYLVQARQDNEATGNPDVLGEAFLTTVIALGEKIGYRNQNQIYQEYQPSEDENIWQIIIPMILLLGFGGIILYFGMKGRGRRFGSRGLGGGSLGGSGFGWGGILGGLGWSGGGGFSRGPGGGGAGGGGGSSGGGAGGGGGSSGGGGGSSGGGGAGR